MPKLRPGTLTRNANHEPFFALSLRGILLACLVLLPLLFSTNALAAPSENDLDSADSNSGDEAKPPVESKAEAANVLALSVAVQAPLSLDKDNPFGGGIAYTREYFVGRRTALGVHAAARVFPGAPFHFTFGYGLTIKHYLASLGNAGPRSGLYFLYGLLMQMNYLEGRTGTATGHDTRMAVGYDFRRGSYFPVFELGYHLTQVRSFDEETLWWPYTELLAGLRF